MSKIIVLCGPTACGKSFAAMKIAQSIGGVIINADAMQIYSQLKIITSSPSDYDKIKIKHYLYNHIDITEEYSVAKYVMQAVEIIKSIPVSVPIIIVGGTGLYVNSLIYGMHQIPDIDNQIRQDIRNQVKNLGIEHIYHKLAKIDPNSVTKLNKADTKRICRAYEVYMQTGRAIDSFYIDQNFYQPLKDYNIQTILFNPERQFLYQMCDTRFDDFIHKGAINEAANLLDAWDDFDTSAKKALGLEQIIDYLKGAVLMQDAITLAKIKTKNFAKRQVTWFKHQLKASQNFDFINQEQYLAILDQMVEKYLY